MNGLEVPGQGRWLLVSDVDDTLTGDAAALAALVGELDACRDRIALALNSSRPHASVSRTLAEEFPPDFRPEAIVTALGTEISVAGRPLAAWADRFSGWPAHDVFGLLAGLGHRPHESEFQTPLKVSFAVEAADRGMAIAALAAHGLPCRTIVSGETDFDVIPPGAGKDRAALFLAETLGIPAGRIVAAGDSANDLALFQVARHAIAVGNAREELLSAMPAERSYHARAPHAGGVYEGLVHFGMLPHASA